MLLESDLDKIDKGDDTLQRFRYQITYSAIVATYLLAEVEEIGVEAVYCEHWEDILVKQSDGKFVGVQVKTRENHLGAFSLDDEPIKKALLKFCRLEKDFGENFNHYTLVTNVGFMKKTSLHQNIGEVVKKCREKNTNELTAKRTAISRIVKDLASDADTTIEIVFQTLAKIKLKEDAPQLMDIKGSLLNKIRLYKAAGQMTLNQHELIVDKLIYKCFQAASLDIPEIQKEYDQLFASTPPSSKLIIESKKIIKQDIEKMILECTSKDITLSMLNATAIEKLPSGYSVLEKKMNAGGISFENVDLVKSLKFSTTSLMTKWLHKGPDDAQKKYEQIKIIVQTVCQEIYDQHKNDDGHFGELMLNKVRDAIKARYADDRDSFFDCKYEHLIGMAGLLSEECKVWWSKHFDLSELDAGIVLHITFAGER